MNIFSEITKRTMKQNRSRTVVTMIGVLLSTAMVTAVTSFGASIQQYLAESSIRQEGNWHGVVSGISEKLAEEIREDERLSMTAEAVRLGTATCSELEENGIENGLVLESYSEEFFENVPVELQEGRLPENEDEILLPEYINSGLPADRQILTGDSLELQLETGEKTCRVTGFYTNSVWTSYEEESASYAILGPGADEGISRRIIFRMKNMRKTYSYVEEIKDKLAEEAPGGSAAVHDDLLQWYGIGDNRNLMIVLVSLMVIVIGLIMVGSVSLIYNAFSISLRERTRQFGLLSSVGATKKQLKKALNYEARSVCILGIPLGILSGLLGIGITLRFIGPLMARWIHGEDGGEISLKISWAAVLAAVLIAWITVKLSVWIPARRLKQISPMEAIRSSRDIKIRNTKVGSGGLAGKLFGLEGMLASKNYRRDRKKYRTTVVSLTLSIVLFVTAGSFVQYLTAAGNEVFRSTDMDIWLSLSDLVSGSGEEQKEKAMEELKQIEGISEIRPADHLSMSAVFPRELLQEAEVMYGEECSDGRRLFGCHVNILPDEQFLEYAESVGEKGEDYIGQDRLKGICVDTVRSVDQETSQYKNQTLLDIPEGYEMECGIEQMTEDYVATGVLENSFSIQIEKKTDQLPRESTVSYFSASISVTVPESAYETFAGGGERERFSRDIYLKTEDRKAVIRELTEKRTDASSAFYQCGYYDLKADYEQDQSIILVIRVLTGGFVALMSLVAVANIFNTISTNLFLRRREFAMLRSAGMTQKGFRRMMGCECLIYGIRSICYGVLISAGTSFLVYRSTSFGVSYQFTLPWLYWEISAAAVLVVVAATMLYSMKKMKGDNVIEILKQS